MKGLSLLAVLFAVGISIADSPPVTVQHDGSQARLARTLADRAHEVIQRLEAEFGLILDSPVTIVLTSSQAEFERAQPFGGQAPSWAAALAYPDLGLIILKSRRADSGISLEEALAHEMTHVALGRLFQRQSVPTWLNEGLTMHVAGEWGLTRYMAMARAVASDRVIPLNRLVRAFPADQIGAETAYSESYYFVTFLRDRYGSQVLGRLIRNLGLGISADHALYQATGLRTDELDDEFNTWLAHRFAWFWISTGSGAIWFLAVLLFTAAWAAKKRATSRRLRQWEAEDECQAGPGRSRGSGGEDGGGCPL